MSVFEHIQKHDTSPLFAAFGLFKRGIIVGGFDKSRQNCGVG
jgi:hypothetical protein